MCFFDQITWSCGAWRWGNLRQQCDKEHRIGEVCGLKLIYKTEVQPRSCKNCHLISIKNRRIAKLWWDIERWTRAGDKPASLAKAKEDLAKVWHEAEELRALHVSDDLVTRFPGRTRRKRLLPSSSTFLD